MREVKFKFDLDDKVHSELEGNGIINMLGVDDGGIQYSVRTAKVYRWVKERDLEAGWIYDEQPEKQPTGRLRSLKDLV